MRRALPLFGVLLLAGCAGAAKPLVRVSPFPPLASLAVLPFDNETVDLDGPPLLRKEVSAGLQRRRYRVLETAEVDEKLKTAFGITDGGQLRSVEPKALAAALGVDGVVYGTLVEFGYQNVGFYKNRKVAARLRLIEASGGQVVWEDERSVQNRDVALSKKDAKRDFFLGIVERQLGKALGSPLLAETHLVVARLLKSLPKAR